MTGGHRAPAPLAGGPETSGGGVRVDHQVVPQRLPCAGPRGRSCTRPRWPGDLPQRERQPRRQARARGRSGRLRLPEHRRLQRGRAQRGQRVARRQHLRPRSSCSAQRPSRTVAATRSARPPPGPPARPRARATRWMEIPLKPERRRSGPLHLHHALHCRASSNRSHIASLSDSGRSWAGGPAAARRGQLRSPPAGYVRAAGALQVASAAGGTRRRGGVKSMNGVGEQRAGVERSAGAAVRAAVPHRRPRPRRRTGPRPPAKNTSAVATRRSRAARQEARQRLRLGTSVSTSMRSPPCGTLPRGSQPVDGGDAHRRGRARVRRPAHQRRLLHPGPRPAQAAYPPGAARSRPSAPAASDMPPDAQRAPGTPAAAPPAARQLGHQRLAVRAVQKGCPAALRLSAPCSSLPPETFPR
jgi:hypothetical protein